jgi:ribosomal protein L7/L12
MTAAVVGLGGAVMGSVGKGTMALATCSANTIAAVNIGGGFLVDSSTARAVAVKAVQDNPDRKIDAIKATRAALRAGAPEGYNTSSFYVDNETGKPMYISLDRTTFSLDGKEISAEAYWASGRQAEGGGLKYLKGLVEEVMANPEAQVSGDGAYQREAACDSTVPLAARPLENMSARDMFAKALAQYPSQKISAIKAGRSNMNAATPKGYLFSPEMIDVESGYPIYISQDGSSYRIGEKVVSVAEYQASGKQFEYGGLKYAKKMIETLQAEKG